MLALFLVILALNSVLIVCLERACPSPLILFVMFSRFPSVRPLDYCFNPIRVNQDNEFVTVPCGHCAGCLLHKSNSWEFRLEDEILNCPFPLFITLTYYNKYLPHFSLYKCSLGASGSRFYHYTCDSDYMPFSYPNLRRVYSRKKDCFYEVLRDDLLDDIVSDIPVNLRIENLKAPFTSNYFSYVSKRDIQLFKKQLKSLILDYVESTNSVEDPTFRSFIISEYGPQTFRGHYHGILLFRSEAVAHKVQCDLLYKAWPMQDRSLLEQYCTFTNKGVGEYVSSYVTQFSALPQVIRENKQVRPFRLSSKAPSIGFIAYDGKEIFEKVVTGIIEYNKTISDVEQDFILRYPALFCARLFPKCRGFRLASFERLYRVYGVLWRAFRKGERYYSVTLARLRTNVPAQDYYSSLICLRTCLSFNIHPHTYVYALDMYYYKVAMLNLRDWYKWQSEQMSCGNYFTVLTSYSNLYDLLHSFSPSVYLNAALYFFACSFGLDLQDLRSMSYSDLTVVTDEKLRYISEVEDIVNNLDKSKKVNEKLSVSPTKLSLNV